MENGGFEDPIYQVSNRYADVTEKSFDLLINKTGVIEAAYDKFVTDFAPGEFSGYLRIYAPEGILEYWDSIHATIDSGSWKYTELITREMCKSAVVFAETNDSDYFAYIPGMVNTIFCFPRHGGELISINGDLEALCHWVASSGVVVEQFEARYYKTFPRAQLRFQQDESFKPYNMGDIRDMLTAFGAPAYYVETDSKIESFYRANGIHISYSEQGDSRQFMIDLDLPAKPESLIKLSQPISAIGLWVSEFYELQEAELIKVGFKLV